MHWRLNPRYDRACKFSWQHLGHSRRLTSLWGVPITIYLVMKQVSPRQFVDASGFLILIGCIPLAVGYSVTGCPEQPACGPVRRVAEAAIIGFTIGERFLPLLA